MECLFTYICVLYIIIYIYMCAIHYVLYICVISTYVRMYALMHGHALTNRGNGLWGGEGGAR